MPRADKEVIPDVMGRCSFKDCAFLLLCGEFEILKMIADFFHHSTDFLWGLRRIPSACIAENRCAQSWCRKCHHPRRTSYSHSSVSCSSPVKSAFYPCKADGEIRFESVRTVSCCEFGLWGHNPMLVTHGDVGALMCIS